MKLDSIVSIHGNECVFVYQELLPQLAIVMICFSPIYGISSFSIIISNKAFYYLHCSCSDDGDVEMKNYCFLGFYLSDVLT